MAILGSIRSVLFIILVSLFSVACGGGASGDDDVQVSETRSDGEDLSDDDEAAAEFLRSELMKYYVKTPDGWTTQMQQYNVLGEVMPDRVPVELFRQHRELSFALSPKPLDESMKLNGVDYRAEARFKDSPVRYYHTEAGYEWPQGWDDWSDGLFAMTVVALERRNGTWLEPNNHLFNGIKPTMAIP